MCVRKVKWLCYDDHIGKINWLGIIYQRKKETKRNRKRRERMLKLFLHLFLRLFVHYGVIIKRKKWSEKICQFSKLKFQQKNSQMIGKNQMTISDFIDKIDILLQPRYIQCFTLSTYIEYWISINDDISIDNNRGLCVCVCE